MAFNRLFYLFVYLLAAAGAAHAARGSLRERAIGRKLAHDRTTRLYQRRTLQTARLPSVSLFDRCGGLAPNGPWPTDTNPSMSRDACFARCPSGTSCFRQNEFYWQCLTECPSTGWDCTQDAACSDPSGIDPPLLPPSYPPPSSPPPVYSPPALPPTYPSPAPSSLDGFPAYYYYFFPSLSPGGYGGYPASIPVPDAYYTPSADASYYYSPGTNYYYSYPSPSPGGYGGYPASIPVPDAYYAPSADASYYYSPETNYYYYPWSGSSYYYGRPSPTPTYTASPRP